MNRFSLAGQVAVIVAVAIFLVQIFNLGIAVDHRRDLALNQSVTPAAQRLILAAERPEILERRQLRHDRRAQRMERSGRRGPRDRFLRPRTASSDPVPANAERLPAAEDVLAARFAEAGIGTRAVSVGALEPPRHRGERQVLVFGVQLDDGQWLALRAPGPPSMRPLIAMLTLQSLLIGIAILIPTLLLLRRVGGSLGRLREAALAFDGVAPEHPVTSGGPRDVAALIDAVNAMQTRIATMLAEKDVMLGAIGHDLRTPLTALRIEAEEIEDEERREALVTQVERLHAQFEAILDLARSARPLSPGQMVDVARLLDRLAETYRGRPVHFHRTANGSFPGDPAAIERALANLLDNGLRHASRVDVHPLIDGEGIGFLVEDDGPGIPDAERARMMRPFERGDSSRSRETGGHGLGLAIVAAIARRHRGTLTLGGREDGRPGLAALLAFAPLSGSAQPLH